MATATITTLLDGDKRIILHVAVIGDAGADLTGSVIYDFATDTNNPNGTLNSGVIEWVQHSQNQFDINIDFAGATPFLAWMLPQNTAQTMNFGYFAGIPNKAVTPTGNVTITTTGVTTGEYGTFVISIRKT